MRLHRVRSLDEYHNHLKRDAVELNQHKLFLEQLVLNREFPFVYNAYSYTAGKESELIVDLNHSNKGEVNWRERLGCKATHFNNRMRAACQLYDIEIEPYYNDSIYITEQLTPMYSYFKEKFPNTVGSEYLGDDIALGSINHVGLRNEDLTRLTMDNEKFDAVISFDVFEHIPNFIDAFSECYRVLKAGGRLFWTVPFIFNSRENIIRSVIKEGELVHILEPEYHGNPTTNSKILCFQHFGWAMLDDIKKVGFKDAYAVLFRSEEFGYLGFNQAVFVAIK